MSTLICPECKSIGSKSTLQEVFWGQFKDNSLGVANFIDEDGHSHYHATDKTVRIYRCSNGHDVKHTSRNKCGVPKCEFGDPEFFVNIEWWPF